MDGLDIIGDIHGQAEPLRALLHKLGYRLAPCSNIHFRHPSRKVVFVGDFVDRGPAQRDTVNIARSMVEDDAAFAIMGNHEYNALAYYTPDPAKKDSFLREHTPKNTAQHQAFLNEYLQTPQELEDTIRWFSSLPLWLDFGDLRIIHATWNEKAMAAIRSQLGESNTLTPQLLIDSSRKGHPAHDAVETLLKGLEARLPEGISYLDGDGNPRQHARLKWWQQPEGETWQTLALVPGEKTRAQLPDTALPEGLDLGYGDSKPPVFFGHYWLQGEPHLQAKNAVCVDYSVARPGGKLVAYRWDNEAKLDAKRMVAVASNAFK